MQLIATHNSATGERSKNWFCRLMTPIARCQALTIEEQYHEGCTYFDLRVRRSRDGSYRLCHGLWQSGKTLGKVLDELNRCSRMCASHPKVTVFYEGKLKTEAKRDRFLNDMYDYMKAYVNIDFVSLGVKLPHWRTLRSFANVPNKQDYKKITGWSVMLPIPFLWWMFRPDPQFNTETYTMVDFL